MKKILFSVIVMAALVGCSSNSDSDASEPLKISTMDSEEHYQTDIVKEFIEDVEEKTDESIEFDLYPANQLGDYSTVFDEVIKGTVDGAFLSVPSSIDERTEILNMPYLANNYEQGEKLLASDSYFYEYIEDILDEQNLHLVGMLPVGFGGIGTTKEINEHDKIEEDANLLVRIPEMSVYKNYADAMGFRTSSIPYDDVFTALQTDTVEGTVGASGVSNYVNYRDVLKNFYAYNNTFESRALIMNKDLWESFTEEEKEIISEEGLNFTTNGLKVAEEEDAQALKDLEEEGINVEEYSSEELDEFSEYIREKVWPQSEDIIEKETLDKISEEIK